MAREKKASTSAKILYCPIGIVGSIVAGVVSAQVFKQVWKRALLVTVPTHPRRSSRSTT